jgi:hypothetical protein
MSLLRQAQSANRGEPELPTALYSQLRLSLERTERVIGFAKQITLSMSILHFAIN